MSRLSKRERSIRALLSKVAGLKIATSREGLISYKELWERISRKKWGRARVDEIVPMILNISEFELKGSRPPLNEIVVNKLTGEPGEEWENIKSNLEKRVGKRIGYSTHKDARIACWRYWQRKLLPSASVNGLEENESVEEGLKQDRTVAFRRRNREIIRLRKEKDNYQCQACGFLLKVKNRYIIECHHKYPLGGSDKVRITAIGDLVCLCPTCHRISHSEKFPLDTVEIVKLRKQAKWLIPVVRR